jgi:chromosome segregation protein
MRIQRLELHGFKSFVDPTVMHLGPGIAAVVGPNGCGKSNVIDAIRWTLGEQSPGTLRGKAMSDVIFAGSQGRPRANHAEVTLVFDNTDGSFGGRQRRYAEIAVTRRLDRSGASTYAINRQRCRLKDIVDLFVDTGVGARAYSIIEQGRVGFVVSARPEERKLLIDEVAGVNRFKGQRVEAERRMKETRANLVRLADLAGELGRHRDGLAAQARTARRFMELRNRWKETSLRGAAVETTHLVAKQREFALAFAAAESELEGLREEEAAAVAEAVKARAGEAAAVAASALHRERRAALDATVAAAASQGRDQLDELQALQERIERHSDELAELGRAAKGARGRQEAAAVAAAEAKERLARARSSQEAALVAVVAETERIAAARAALEESKQRQLDAMTAGARQRNSIALLERRLVDTADELRDEQQSREADHRRRQEMEVAATAASVALDAAVEERGAIQAARDAALAALETARAGSRVAGDLASQASQEVARLTATVSAEEDLVRSLADAQPGVRALVEWLEGVGAETVAGKGFLGVVADGLRVPPGLESTVELALDDLVDAVVFGDDDALRGAIDWMSRSRPGRAALLRLARTAETPVGLAAQVDEVDGMPGLAAQLLGGLSVIDSSAGLELQPGARAVLLPAARVTGEVVRFGGRGAAGSPLVRRARVRALREQLEAAQRKAEEALHGRDRASAAVAAARAASEATSTALHDAELRELGARRDLEQARKALRAIGDEEARAAGRRARMEETSRRLAGELERVRADAAATEAAREVIDRELEERRSEVRAAEQAGAQASARGTAAQLDLAEARHEAATLERDHRRLSEEQNQRTQRAERIERELAIAAKRAEKIELRRAELRESAARSAAALSSLEDEQPALEGAAVAARDRAQAAKDAEALVRTRLAAASQRHARIVGEGARLEARLELLSGRGRDEFGVEILVAASSLLDSGIATLETPSGPGRPPVRVELARADLDEDPRLLATAAARLAREADSLGAVNMAAAEEFAEVDERWRALSAQQADLEAALADLRRAIRTIEQETRQRFREAFDAVASRFGALYPRLVGGGKAELLLTEPEDLLATGVEIRVEPPGKRLQNLQLLSGGEKAMAAIAFVFAIFEVKPSPFCLLDEVDAPLDDANSRRFNGMLAELAATTQFMVITHNRTTMEVADVLYGVTMQTPGVSSVVSVRVDASEPAARMRGPNGEEHP